MKLKALIHSGSIALYCLGVGFVMFHANSIFGNYPSFLAPVTVLLLLSISVLICGLLSFYQPYLLFFANKKKEAIEFVLYETLWLFVFFVTILLVAAFVH